MPTPPPSEPLPLLDPTNDLVFKLLLTGPNSHDVLAYVLRGVLGPAAVIEDFVVLDAALSPADVDAKAIVFDVRVALTDGTQLDVEMQCLPTRAFHALELPKLGTLDAHAEDAHDPLVVFSRFLTARSREALTSLAQEDPAMKQAIDILEHLSSDAAVRRRAADREARIRLDEMYRREELEEAKAEARAEGRAEGDALARVVLVRLLESRFGSLLDAQRRIVESASREQIERWAAHALVASSLAEVFAS